MRISVLFLLFFYLPCLASVAPSNDQYFIYENNGYRYVFSESDRKTLPYIVKYNEWLTTKYQKAFNWKLDETTSLNLTSPRNQVANAFATSIPLSITTLYRGGMGYTDFFSSESWLDSLLLHESAHLYQLNVKDYFPAFGKKIFGNGFFAYPMIPIPSTPTLFLPNSFLEGNSTYNESRFLVGGRLFTASIYAQNLALLKGGKVTEEFLFNAHGQYPYGTEKYHMGGLFFAFLAEKFGDVQANGFFREYSKRWLWPWAINRSFRRHFGQSFDQLFVEFKAKYMPIAKQQVGTGALPAIVAVPYASPIHKDDTEVFFIADDGYNTKTLHSINRETLVISKQQVDLPRGRLFKVDNTFYVGAQVLQTLDGLGTFSGLYGEGYKIKPGTKNLDIADINGTNVLSFDLTKPFVEQKFHLNNEAYDSTVSRPLFQGKDIAYTKRSGNSINVLINKKVIKTINTESVQLVDSDKENLYFIAATPFGSSLYSLSTQSKTIKRLFNYDTIVDAQKINDGSFLLTSVTDSDYRYVIAKPTPVKELPFRIKYGFKTQRADGEELQKVKLAAKDFTIEDSQISKYYPLTQLKLSFWTLSYLLTNETEMEGSIGALFIDPLQTNSLLLTVGATNYSSDVPASLLYSNTKNRLSWGLAFRSNPKPSFDALKVYISSKERTQLSASLGYTFLRYGHHNVSGNIDFSSVNDKSKPEEYTNTDTQLSYNYSISHSLGAGPSIAHSLALTHSDKEADLIESLGYSITKDLLSQTYLTMGASGKYSKNGSIEISESPLIMSREIGVNNLSSPVFTNETAVGTIGLQQYLDFEYYSNAILFGVKDIAPLATYRSINYKDLTTKKFNAINEASLGFQITLVFGYKFAIPIAITQTEDLKNNISDLVFDLNYKKEF